MPMPFVFVVLYILSSKKEDQISIIFPFSVYSQKPLDCEEQRDRVGRDVERCQNHDDNHYTGAGY